MRVAEYVVRFFEERGYDYVFGLPGWNVLELYDALKSSSLEHVLFRHENSAAVAADAYGRVSGRPGLCIVTAGPGATNSVTAVAGAYAAASPMIHVSGHCPIRAGPQPYHCVDDPLFLEKVFASVTKLSRTARSPSEVPELLEKGFRTATSGRPGPVHVSIPMDLLGEEVGELRGATPIQGGGGEAADLRSVAGQLLRLVEGCRRPVIVAGLGVLRSRCWERVLLLAERLGAPVFVSTWGRGAVPHNHPLAADYVAVSLFGKLHPAIKGVLEEADLVIGLGLEVGMRVALARSAGHAFLLNVYQGDGAGAAVLRSGSAELPVQSLCDAIGVLLELLPGRIGGGWSGPERLVAEVKGVIERELSEYLSSFSSSRPIHSGYVARVLKRVAERDAVIATDVGSSSIWFETVWRVETPNTLLTPGRYGSMGFSLPAAIAAKKILGDRQVIAVAGDGGMLMMLGELATLAEQRLGVLVLVLNDAHYGILWRVQAKRFSKRFIAVETAPPNFARCAESFGVKGLRVEDPKDLEPVLEEALALERPVVVEVLTAHHHEHYPYTF